MGRIRLLPVIVVSLAALVTGSVAAAVAWSHLSRRVPGGRVVADSINSRAVDGPLRFAVWLPAGYATNVRRRYPVLYVLHGLPGDEMTYRSLLFLVPILDRLRAQALVVFPQGARAGDSDDEYLDLGPGRDWATALTHELPTAVDSRYRTLRSRSARGIIGISAGGYGAVVLGLHNLGRYGVIESWSGYFHATTPDGSAPMPLGPRLAAWADVHRLVRRLATELRRMPTLLAFYTGSRDPYPGFTSENKRFDRELRAAGVPHRFVVYPGGHSAGLWLTHASDWLSLAMKALAPAR